MLPLLLSAALAADPETPVLVSSLQARNAEATGLASLVENFLVRELDKHPNIRVIRVEDTPDFKDYPARTYMEGCPPGEIVGCTYVLGERGGATLAVTGTVQSLVGGTKVTIEILDIENARQVIKFQSELDAGSDEAFAEGVAKVLVAAIDGEIGQERDIRFEDGEETAEPMDNEAVARQLKELSRELGGVTATISRNDRAIPRTTYTVEDLAKRAEGEGAKPWERLDMSMGEYLRYKNSGMQLFEWRERSLGRKGQLLLRPAVGFASGPYSGTYYGRIAYDVVSANLQVVDAYSAQAVQTGSGGTFGVSLGYGLSPVVDVGLTLGVTTGNYTVDVASETVGQASSAPEPETFTQTTLSGGPRVTATLFPVLPFRPSFGGSVLVLRGNTTVDPANNPEELTIWSPPVMVAGEIFIGGEARISRTVDAYVHVPLQIRLAGDTLSTGRVGIAEEVDATAPGQAAVIGAGVVAGLQIRLFGAKAKETTRIDEMEEPDE